MTSPAESLFDSRIAKIRGECDRILDPSSNVLLYPTLEEFAEDVRMILAVAEAAQDFVATTSYYRQTKASRAEFEQMALALLAARGYETVARPERWEREQMGAPE